MSRRKRSLTDEERQLWSRIRETVTPLSGKAKEARIEEGIEEWIEHPVPAPQPPERAKMPERPVFPSQRRAEPFLPPYIPPVSRPGQPAGAPMLDDATIKRLRKGRLEIDARIDLHGLTEAAAHDALLRFVRTEQRRDSRIVLVITGKGKAGEGVLRRAVPLWFAEAAFKPLVGGYRKAHPAHGGEGALYLRIRRESRP
jgi:DNA-nicking Smr family endonuclease